MPVSLIDCKHFAPGSAFLMKGACGFNSAQVRANKCLMVCPGNGINCADLKFLMLNDPTWRY